MEDDININNIFRVFMTVEYVDVSSLISSDWRTRIVSTDTMMIISDDMIPRRRWEGSLHGT